MRKSKGFTLIELLVVIAIIALLLAILMPSLKMAKETARRMVCGTNLKSIGTGIHMYASQFDDLLPMANYHPQQGSETHGSPRAAFIIFKWLGEGEAGNLGVLDMPPGERLDAILSLEDHFSNFGWLLKEKVLEPYPEIFYCPSSKGSYETYGGDENWPFPQSPWEHVESTYIYFPQHRTQTMHPDAGSFPSGAKKLTKAHPSLSMALDGMDGSISHRKAGNVGLNMLYTDGSVSFRNSERLRKAIATGGEGLTNMGKGGQQTLAGTDQRLRVREERHKAKGISG